MPWLRPVRLNVKTGLKEAGMGRSRRLFDWRVVLVIIQIVFLSAVAKSEAVTIDFDSIPASCCYSHVLPGGPRGPVLALPDVTLNGGVVMDNTGWAGLAPSAPNLYGTSDFFPLADASLLPGFITISFSSSVSSVMMDIINGYGASTFTLSALDVSGLLIGSSSIFLPGFPSPSAVGSLAFSGPGIYYVMVTSAQSPGSIDFAIDNLTFALTPAPEPSTFILLGAGIAGIGILRRVRKNRKG